MLRKMFTCAIFIWYNTTLDTMDVKEYTLSKEGLFE
jgi:hypothetical protein